MQQQDTKLGEVGEMMEIKLDKPKIFKQMLELAALTALLVTRAE